MDDHKQMQDLCDLFAQAAKDAGHVVPAHGYGGYSGGSFFNMEVKLPGGLEVYVEIKESQDDNYLIDRYESEDEPVDPERESTPPMNEDQADALARELEYERTFSDREISMRVEDMEPDIGDDAI